jgi:hypothetical protein
MKNSKSGPVRPDGLIPGEEDNRVCIEREDEFIQKKDDFEAGGRDKDFIQE